MILHRMTQAIFILLLVHLPHISSFAPSECSPDQTVCEYHFRIHEALTMHMYPFGRVGATNGTLHLMKKNPNNITLTVPEDRVIIADGHPRMVTVINHQLPGPPIIVYEGQHVIVHVTNDLTSETTTLHWHGLHMVGTPWMDGTSMITQCPITPGQKFTYKFIASPTGTHYYHSHVNGQRMDGLFGALIVRPKPPTQQQREQKVEAIMQVTDWWHESSSKVGLRSLNMDYISQPGYRPSFLPNGVNLHPLNYYSMLVEGRGRYTDPRTGVTTETPYKLYNIKPGTQLRFRLISAANVLPFRVSVDNHVLVVIATDGNEIIPRTFQSLMVNPGERFDFLVTANQDTGNYWIRIQTLQHFPDHQSHKCTQLHQLETRERNKEVARIDNDIKEHFLNFGSSFSMKEGYNMWVNGVVHQNKYSHLLNDKGVYEKNSCDGEGCRNNKGAVCHCFHSLTIPFNKTIQLVISSISTDSHPYNHPIHIHGYSTQLLHIGHAQQDSITGINTGMNQDIECSDNTCHQVRWRGGKTGKSFFNGRQNNVLKDTVNVPSGGYVVVRFRSTNVGKWLIHCHNAFDQKNGMALVLNVAPQLQTSPPEAMPTCKNFDNDEKNITNQAHLSNDGNTFVKDNYYLSCAHILFFAVLAVFVVENIALALYFICTRYSRKTTKEKMQYTYVNKMEVMQ